MKFMARPEYDRFRNALESLVERTVDALERGRDEVLKEARVGKVKLLDIYQLRRERGRLYQRLGEEVYGLVRKGALEIPALSRTLAKIAALDEKITAKELEVDRLREQEGADVDFSSAPSKPVASESASSSSLKKKASSKKKSKKTSRKKTSSKKSSKKKSSKKKSKKKGKGGKKKSKRTLGGGDD